MEPTNPPENKPATTVTTGQSPPAPVQEKPKRKPRVTQQAMVTLSFDNDQGFALAQRRASALSVATAVPAIFQGPPGSPGFGNTLIALELAHRLNFPVLLVMQNLTLIDGKPGWQGKFFVALVQAGTAFINHDWEVHAEPEPGTPPPDAYAKRMVATRVSDGKRCVGEWVSVKMAKEKGWWSKVDRNGVERSHWPSMTGQMLTYRSASFWTNQWNPSATLGLRSADELEDVAPHPEQLVGAPPPPLRFERPQVRNDLAPASVTTIHPEVAPIEARDVTPPAEDHTLEPGVDPISMERELHQAEPAAEAYGALNVALAAKDWRAAMLEVSRLPRGAVRDGAVDLYNQARKAVAP